MAAGIRSRKVRRILRLEAQAIAWRRRAERARTRMELFRRRMTAYLSEARAVEASLTTSTEREELQRARTQTVSGPGEDGPGCRA
jgi:hypothetical protein